MRSEVQTIVRQWLVKVVTNNRVHVYGHAAFSLGQPRGSGESDVRRLVDQEIDAIVKLLEAPFALSLDQEEFGATFTALVMIDRGSSGEGPYLDAARRVLDRMVPHSLLTRKDGPQA